MFPHPQPGAELPPAAVAMLWACHDLKAPPLVRYAVDMHVRPKLAGGGPLLMDGKAFNEPWLQPLSICTEPL